VKHILKVQLGALALLGLVLLWELAGGRRAQSQVGEHNLK
jgi:hypothetical protein